MSVVTNVHVSIDEALGSPVGGAALLTSNLVDLVNARILSAVDEKRHAQYSVRSDRLAVAGLVRVFQVHPPPKITKAAIKVAEKHLKKLDPSAPGSRTIERFLPSTERFLARCAFNILVLPAKLISDLAIADTDASASDVINPLQGFISKANDVIHFTSSSLDGAYLPRPADSMDALESASSTLMRSETAEVSELSRDRFSPTVDSPPHLHPCGGPLFVFIVGHGSKVKCESRNFAKAIAKMMLLDRSVSAFRHFDKEVDVAKEIVRLAAYVQEGRVEKRRSVLNIENAKSDVADPGRLYRHMLMEIDGFGGGLVQSIMGHFPTLTSLVSSVCELSRESFVQHVGNLATDRDELRARRIGPNNAAKLYDSFKVDHRGRDALAFDLPSGGSYGGGNSTAQQQKPVGGQNQGDRSPHRDIAAPPVVGRARGGRGGGGGRGGTRGPAAMDHALRPPLTSAPGLRLAASTIVDTEPIATVLASIADVALPGDDDDDHSDSYCFSGPTSAPGVGRLRQHAEEDEFLQW